MKYIVKKIDEKLYITSRDIQVGDKVKFPESLKDTIIDTSKGLDLGSYKIYGYFKVIGEISPEAKWVKEGDEFDDSELAFQLYKDFNHKFTDIKVWNNDFVMKYPISIKCPCCGTFK